MNPPLLQEIISEEDIGGASGTQKFLLMAHGKGNSERFPYNVPNEKIASELARVVGLPVPEVLLYQHRGEWLFLSRTIGTVGSGEVRPLGTSQQVADAVANSPGLSEGAVCVDLFVCNNDRNPRNFLLDDQRQLWLIDFGNALFYRPSGGGKIQPGIARLESVEADFNALFDKEYALLSSCKTWESMVLYCERIAAIPTYFIENIVNRLPEELLTPAERVFVIDFLIRRKAQMQGVIEAHLHLFPICPIHLYRNLR